MNGRALLPAVWQTGTGVGDGRRWQVGGSSHSVSGNSTPAKPGEVVGLYAVAFGLPTPVLSSGSASQSGLLPVLSVMRGGEDAGGGGLYIACT